MKRAVASAAIQVACVAVLLSCSGGETGEIVTPPPPPPPTPEFPITGAQVPGFASFDQSVRQIMQKYKIPGGAFALVRDGRLVYARGFGYADAENKVPVQPDARFRIASVSKSITSAAIMKLIEDGKLTLDDRVAPIIADLTPPPGATVDPRWEQITIRNLLDHTAGWDRDKPNGFDPMFQSAIAAAAVGAPAPASAETIIRWMKGMPLDFNPGQKWVYSNFGYDILGRVIERLGGMSYEEFVRTRVLQPVGANRTRLGKSHMSDALPDEVKYYVAGLGVNSPPVLSVFPGEGEVPLNYGGYYLEATDSHGGWVSSTIDLLRFLDGIDGRPSPPDILKPQTVAEMTSNGPIACSDNSCIYAGGWWVHPIGNNATWWHGGDYPGTKAFIVRYASGTSWAALFNAGASNTMIDELETALVQAINSMQSWPAGDLFPSFP